MAKIFISYCHEDEDFLTDNLIPVFDKLSAENEIEYFYDRKLRSGGDLFDTIDYHLKDSDMAVLLLSEHFYNSETCLKEKNALLERKQLEGIYLLPLVISDCDWLKDKDLSKDLLLNTDGKSLISFNKQQIENELQNIENRLIQINKDIEIIKNLTYQESFSVFLEDTGIFKTSHKSRNTLKLTDIFVYPELRKYRADEDEKDDFDSEKMFLESKGYKYIFISGDSQSGRTSLLKMIISSICGNFFIPLYFSYEDSFDGHIFNILSRKFREQYSNPFSDEELKVFLENNKDKIVLFFDDFNKLKNKKKIIDKISIIPKIICTIDLIYNLDTEIQSIQSELVKYTIKEFSPIKRNEIIKKWLYLDQEITSEGEYRLVKELDKKTNEIETITGKSLNGGIMPAYPFLILSILSNVETLNRPLNQQITSYGYCYEALIIIAFTKIGLRTDDELSGCINFLSEFAHQLFTAESYEMNCSDFNEFIENYERNIELPYEKDIFISKLLNSRLLIQTSFGNFKFDYKYIYYYFVANYLADNQSANLDEIRNICLNIHKDENAYILIFFSHKSKSDSFYRVLINEANSLFDNNRPITLSKNDTSFFGNGYKALLDEVLPNRNHNYKAERNTRLENRNEKEYSEYNENELDSLTDEYSTNLRKSIKLVEAIGLIAKNRCTSISKDRINELLKSAINLNLRGLDSFFNLFNNEESQKELIDFFKDAIKKEFEKKEAIEDEKCKEIAYTFFWGMNFLYVFVIIQKTIQSVGSERIIPFITRIAEENPTPINQIILEGTKIIYDNNIDKKNLFRHIKNENYSDLAKSILNMFVIDYCKTHPIKHNEVQQLSDKMHIKIDKMK